MRVRRIPCAILWSREKRGSRRLKREPASVGAEIEFAEDVTLAGVGPGRDVTACPAGRTLFTVEENACLGSQSAGRIVERGHLRQIGGAVAVEGKRGGRRVRLLRGGVPLEN